MANRYSAQQTEDPPVETLNLSGEEVWIRTRKLHIRRRLPRMKQMLKPAGLKPRKQEKFKGEWATQTNGVSICSYTREDLVENYGRFLKRYAKGTVSEERSRVEPFTTSMLDGVKSGKRSGTGVKEALRARKRQILRRGWRTGGDF
jgi:hypothetical protein